MARKSKKQQKEEFDRQVDVYLFAAISYMLPKMECPMILDNLEVVKDIIKQYFENLEELEKYCVQ